MRSMLARTLLLFFLAFPCDCIASPDNALQEIERESMGFVQSVDSQYKEITDAITTLLSRKEFTAMDSDESFMIDSIAMTAYSYLASTMFAEYIQYATRVEAILSKCTKNDLVYYADSLSRFPGSTNNAIQIIVEIENILTSPGIKSEVAAIINMLNKINELFRAWPGASLKKHIESYPSGKAQLPACLINSSINLDNVIDQCIHFSMASNNALPDAKTRSIPHAIALNHLGTRAQMLAFRLSSQFILDIINHRLDEYKDVCESYEAEKKILTAMVEANKNLILVDVAYLDKHCGSALEQIQLNCKELGKSARQYSEKSNDCRNTGK